MVHQRLVSPRLRVFAWIAAVAAAGCAAKPDEAVQDPLRAGQRQLRQGYAQDPADGAKSPVPTEKNCWRCGGSGKAESGGALATCSTCGGSGKTAR